jgi:hypothetical protein
MPIYDYQNEVPVSKCKRCQYHPYNNKTVVALGVISENTVNEDQHTMSVFDLRKKLEKHINVEKT